MIGKLCGIIEEIDNNNVIVNVGGVGYLAYCSGKTIEQLSIGDKAILWIETYFREDHLQLFGFWRKEEKVCFLLLRSVNGIGSKMAIAILSTLTPEQIISAIVAKKKEVFRQVSGVGAKVAERIIVELKDKAAIGLELPIFNNQSSNKAVESFDNIQSKCDDIKLDAISALVNLGINKFEAHNLVKQALQHYEKTNNTQSYTIDQVIKLALKIRLTSNNSSDKF